MFRPTVARSQSSGPAPVGLGPVGKLTLVEPGTLQTKTTGQRNINVNIVN